MRPSPDPGDTLTVTARLEDVRDLATFLREACAQAGVDEMLAFDCELAMVEAANNVVEHGYADAGGGTLSLSVAISSSAVRMELVDQGMPMPEDQFRHCRIVPEDALSGRGVGIIQSCVDEISYSSQAGCNRLVLVRRL